MGPRIVVDTAKKKNFSYLCRISKHDFSVRTYGHSDLLGARQESKSARNEITVRVSLADTHRKNSSTLMFTVVCIVYEHVTGSIEVILTFWRRIFFQILAHPIFKM